MHSESPQGRFAVNIPHVLHSTLKKRNIFGRTLTVGRGVDALLTCQSNPHSAIIASIKILPRPADGSADLAGFLAKICQCPRRASAAGQVDQPGW